MQLLKPGWYQHNHGRSIKLHRIYDLGIDGFLTLCGRKWAIGEAWNWAFIEPIVSRGLRGNSSSLNDFCKTCAEKTRRRHATQVPITPRTDR